MGRKESNQTNALYALAMTNALLRRLCYLGIANLVTLLLHSWRSGQLQAWFKCFPEVGVTQAYSVKDLVKHERFHTHVNE